MFIRLALLMPFVVLAMGRGRLRPNQPDPRDRSTGGCPVTGGNAACLRVPDKFNQGKPVTYKCHNCQRPM